MRRTLALPVAALLVTLVVASGLARAGAPTPVLAGEAMTGYQNLPDGVVVTGTYPDLKDPSAWNVTLTRAAKGGTVVLYVVCIG